MVVKLSVEFGVLVRIWHRVLKGALYTRRHSYLIHFIAVHIEAHD